MPRGSYDDLPLVEIVPGFSSRLADWGGMTVAFEALEQTMEAVHRNYAAGEALGA